MPLRLDDDGRSVRLDLHGVPVDEAERLILRTVGLAVARGRTSVEIVHGASTSDVRYRNRTIRHTLYDLLDDGGLPGVTSDFRREGSALLGLAAGSASDGRRLTLGDVYE